MAGRASVQKKPITPPEFRDVSKKEAEAVLRRNHVGRIAFSFKDRVDIRPINYVYSRGWLFGRTSISPKLVTLGHNQWVAFQVDEISGPFDWISVVARGTFYRLENEGSDADRRLYRRAVRAIRSLWPESLTMGDPVPFRTELFGTSVDEIAGRACSTRRSPARKSRR